MRRFAWTPLEKLSGSVGLSLTLIYLGAWGRYCFGPREQRAVYWAMAAVSVLAGILSWRDAARLVRSFRIRQTLAAFGFLLA